MLARVTAQCANSHPQNVSAKRQFRLNPDPFPPSLPSSREWEQPVDYQPESSTEVELADSAPIVPHPKNKLNALTAAEWITRTVSVFVQKGHGKGSSDALIERQHPAPYSYQDVLRFIEFFSKPGDFIIDPFVGIGSTLKACGIAGRSGVGIELSSKFAELAEERLRRELSPDQLSANSLSVINGDARREIEFLPDDHFSFLVTSPPYWGILNKVDHKARQERISLGLDHKYSESDLDLANIDGYADFLTELTGVFDSASRKLKSKKYICVIVGDFRHKDRYVLFNADLARSLEASGNYILKGVTIIHQKFKRVFPYGYPHAYVPNIHHQSALIFQKTS
jgi:DNA modification methylase